MPLRPFIARGSAVVLPALLFAPPDIARPQPAIEIVDINPVARSAIEQGMPGRIFSNARRIPANITAANVVPNIEALVATRPVLVIQRGGRDPDIVQPITNAGLTAMLILYGVALNMRRDMRDAAAAIGRVDRIAPLVAWCEDVQTQIAAISDRIPPPRARACCICRMRYRA